MRLIVLLIAIMGISAARAEPTIKIIDLEPLARWIQKQDSVESIHSGFTQTRALRALRSPTETSGQFYFQKPASFRWEIGSPPKTVVLGNNREITVIDTRRKEASRSKVDDLANDPRTRGFGMMQFPFATSYADFRERFEVRDLEVNGSICHVEMLPRDAQARRFLSNIAIDFDTDSGHLKAFEITTREGSSLRNEFHDTQTNVHLDPGIFDFDLTGYEVENAKP